MAATSTFCQSKKLRICAKPLLLGSFLTSKSIRAAGTRALKGPGYLYWQNVSRKAHFPGHRKAEALRHRVPAALLEAPTCGHERFRPAAVHAPQLLLCGHLAQVHPYILPGMAIEISNSARVHEPIVLAITCFTAACSEACLGDLVDGISAVA
jgi:hypothetical protein